MNTKRSSTVTGYELFHETILDILDEKGLLHEETLEKLLDAFTSLDDGMRRRIDMLAQLGYKTLPRQMIDKIRESFSFSTPGQQTQDSVAATGVTSPQQDTALVPSSPSSPISTTQFRRFPRPCVVPDSLHVGVFRGDCILAWTLRSVQAPHHRARLYKKSPRSLQT